MKLAQLTTIEAIRQFLAGTQAVAFCVANTKQECYRWVQTTLVTFRYFSLGKADKGLITRHLMKVTGYSHVQVKRLIQQYVKTGPVTTLVRRPISIWPVFRFLICTIQGRVRRLNDQPGYIRIDSVHGDCDAGKNQ